MILPVLFYFKERKMHGKEIPKWEKYVCWFVIGINVLLLFIGTYANILNIIEKYIKVRL